MHVVMAIGRRRTKAMIADECIKFEMIVYRKRERERFNFEQSEERKSREEVAGLRMSLSF